MPPGLFKRALTDAPGGMKKDGSYTRIIASYENR